MFVNVMVTEGCVTRNTLFEAQPKLMGVPVTYAGREVGRVKGTAIKCLSPNRAVLAAEVEISDPEIRQRVSGDPDVARPTFHASRISGVELNLGVSSRVC